MHLLPEITFVMFPSFLDVFRSPEINYIVPQTQGLNYTRNLVYLSSVTSLPPRGKQTMYIVRSGLQYEGLPIEVQCSS